MGENNLHLICDDCGNDETFNYDHDGIGLTCTECGGQNISVKKEYLNE